MAGGPFGALVVVAGRIVGKGWNKVTSTNDPTAHAEIVAIRAACRRLQAYHLPQAVLYSSCEPCPMCFAAACWARVPRIVFAASRKDAAAIGFADEDLYREIALPREARRIRMDQFLQNEARRIMRAWYRTPGIVRY